MTVGGIDNDNIDIRRDHGLNSLIIVHTDRSADAKPTPLVACRDRILLDTVDIPHCDQTGQLTFAVGQ